MWVPPLCGHINLSVLSIKKCIIEKRLRKVKKTLDKTLRSTIIGNMTNEKGNNYVN
jgi:hypothetical protein